ncbi:hypothetical protein SDC9_89416 [bioreactor metagenome]|uniref:Uncharacterized protein n=1 Tax=bioreactor metagenome TaxID=1076179 RepID=A0A644ZPC2_9ZZZZ
MAAIVTDDYGRHVLDIGSYKIQDSGLNLRCKRLFFLTINAYNLLPHSRLAPGHNAGFGNGRPADVLNKTLGINSFGIQDPY